MRPELDNVLQCLSHNGYSVLSLIGDILSHGSNREDRRIQCFLEGVEQNAVDICAQLLNHNSTSTSVSAWALGVALLSQARREHYSHFTTGPPLSLPNGGAVPPSLSFGIASTPTNSLDNSSNVGKGQFARTIVKYERIVLIDPLPDDVFLEIFDFFCLYDFTEYPVQRMKWLILAHVCQRWRRIIFASPRRLDLYLSCICGTPVKRNLVYWPHILPLVVHYPGPIPFCNPTPSDDDNIITALTHANRVHRVKIRVTSSLFRKVAKVMQKPFPVLTSLVLTWFQKDGTGRSPVLPWGFLGGSAPRLEFLYLSGVSFPRLPTLLLSASNLLTLHLDDILQSIPPQTMAAGLAVLTRLSTLSLEFNRVISPLDEWETCSNHPMPTTLPALTLFQYQGYSEYLEDLLVLINTPLVKTIKITYFVEDIQVPQLSQFISRTNTFKDARFKSAYVDFSRDEVEVILNPGRQGKSRADITLTLLGPWSDVVKMLGCRQLIAMFSNVGHLSTHGSGSEWGDMTGLDSIEWLPFFRLFPAVEKLHIYGDAAPYIASALRNIPEVMLTEVMPALHLLWLDKEKRRREDRPIGSIKRFLSLRQLSGHPVTVVNTYDEFKANRRR